MTKLNKKGQGKDAPEHAETVDSSRRKLLGNAGKAAWVTPTLVFLSFTAGSAKSDGPPDPPSNCLPNCPTDDEQGLTSDRGAKRKPGRG